MSKIALSSNPDGTGVFTIASPNSNSDRTLSLPDTSGEMYNQGNILGTVSQSGGVPTGAIIERGSNANGEFVKYADGTMICKHRILFSNVSLTAGNRSILGDWLSPVAFSSAPYSYGVFESTNSNTSGGPALTLTRRGVANDPTYGWSGDVWSFNQTGTFNLSFDFIAIGRWF
jgi:hypothetical protein